MLGIGCETKYIISGVKCPERILAMKYLKVCVVCLTLIAAAFGQEASQSLVSSNTSLSTNDKPRVYLSASSKGNQWNAARDQSMEMSKDFEKDCSGVRVTVNQTAADYTVLLNHIEHGFARDNQIQIANKDGDLISRTKEGGSIRGNIKKACEDILADWSGKH